MYTEMFGIHEPLEVLYSSIVGLFCDVVKQLLECG